jgi:hypothetical protein
LAMLWNDVNVSQSPSSTISSSKKMNNGGTILSIY